MERLVNLRYWERIAAYIIVGAVVLFQIVFFLVAYYSQHDTPLQKLKKKLRRRKKEDKP